MPIVGINIEKCTNCKKCVRECPGVVFEIDEKEDSIIFNSSKICINCGHCISVCPEDAILYKKMKDEAVIFDDIQDPSKLISYDKLIQFIRAKRSIRQYKKKKIPKNVMEKVIESMRYAPTGANLRSMKCLIISDEEKIKTLSKLIQEDLANSIFKLYVPQLNEKRTLGIDPIFHDAPHVMILYSSSVADSGNAFITLTHAKFAAQVLGLGTCWIGMALPSLTSNKEIRKLAGVKGKVLYVMTIGYPSVRYFRAPPRPPMKTIGLDELE